MAEWWFGGDCERAERLMQERPARFFELFGWIEAEIEGEKLNDKWADSARKRQEASDKEAQPRRFPQPAAQPAPPPPAPRLR